MRRVLGLLLFLPSILFADERSVIPGAAGPNRLNPDPALLSKAQRLQYAVRKTFISGLADLRLHDRNGGEVPYLIVPPSTKTDVWLPGRLLPVAATKTTSGLEADLGAVRNVDRVRIEGIAAPFMKRLKLEGSGDRVHYNVLAEDATLFDLPEQQLKNLEVAFTPGEYRYLRVTWNDRSSAVVRSVGSISARAVSNDGPVEETRVTAAFRRVASEPGTSRYRLQLPGVHLPVAKIELTVSNENVLREAAVSESRLDRGQVLPFELGRATLRKASREGTSAANLRVPIDLPEGADLDLVVSDGNNPPLAIDRVDAIFAPLPWIYFEATDASELRATYGDSALTAPRYDLEAKRKSIGSTAVAIARWGATAPAMMSSANTSHLVLKGAKIKPADFRYSRPVASTPAGAARLKLDAEVLAHSRDIADVRIADASDNQIPYLVERCSDPLVLDLKVTARAEKNGRSVYTFALPFDTLPAGTAIVLTTSARVFTRDVQLQRAEDPASPERFPQTLAAARWANADPEHDSPPLRLDVELRGSKAVDLTIDEGDNAPIAIASAKLLVPAVALRFYNPGGSLKLLYGNANALPPRYDIELLASRVFTEPARDMALASATPAKSEEPKKEMRYFWIAIVGAVVVLLAVLARLIGSRAGDGS